MIAMGDDSIPLYTHYKEKTYYGTLDCKMLVG